MEILSCGAGRVSGRKAMRARLTKELSQGRIAPTTWKRQSRLGPHVLSLGIMFAALAGATTRAQPLPPPPVPPQNPITESKRILGKILFWEEQLSSDHTVSCGTCHMPFHAGTDARLAVHPGLDQNFGSPDDVFGSLGVVRRNAANDPIADALFGFGVQVTPRNAQPIYGALWSPQNFWDGRVGPAFTNPQTGVVTIPVGGALEAQAIVPILSSAEMARDGRDWNDVITGLQSVTPLALATYLPPDLDAALAGNPSYAQLFATAFGTPAITAERIAFAIATYERTLVPNQTPFDLGTMTPQQQQGFTVFQAPGSRCNVCHVPPILTNNTFRNIGIRPPNEDIGRQTVTGNPADLGRFKVPALRNVGLKSFFMHNGRRSTLEQVVDFYIGINGQVQFPQNQDPLIPGINIPPAARLNLIEFLRNALTDPRVANETFPFDRPILRSERGDADQDNDVDADDQVEFELCFTGTDGGPVDTDCRRLDMDGDTDIDCDDWTEFAAVWSGPGSPQTPSACLTSTINSPSPAAAPYDRRMNRYVAFAPNNPGQLVAFRVQKTTAPAGSCWVQAPVTAPGVDQFTATCGANPVFRVWTEPVVLVGDCEIIPVADYLVFANGTGPVENPVPLAVGTILLPNVNAKLWGDNVGINNGVEWTAPNQLTNVQDILSLQAFISGAAIRPTFPVANLQAISAADSCLNALVNTADILIAVQATSGGSYGPPATTKFIDPALCAQAASPACPCCGN